MPFDLIIANPPYGDDNKGTLPRKIIKAVKNCTKESIWLMPKPAFLHKVHNENLLPYLKRDVQGDEKYENNTI